jgi:hypothetical protein
MQPLFRPCRAAGRVRSLILDAELVAVERDPGGGAPRLKTFQVLVAAWAARDLAAPFVRPACQRPVEL